MTQDARPADNLDGMTAIAEAPEQPDAVRVKDGRVRCACGAVVKPTRIGGLRPRPHLRTVEVRDEETGELVERTERCPIVHPTETRCKRCGGTPDEPLGTWRFGPRRKRWHSDTICRSPVFHPEEWRGEPTPDNPDGARFGNAAAAGAISGVSGEYFEYILRRPGVSGASRPPEPVGIDLHRRYMYWDLDEVALFEQGRPGLTASAERLSQLRREAQGSEPSE